MIKYHIKPKLDWGRYGYWNPKTRRWERTGFVVCDATCPIINVMPSATWFRTIADAMRGIELLEQSRGDPDVFWNLVRQEVWA